MTVEFPPGLLLIAGGLVLPLFRGTARRLLVLALPLATLAAVWSVPEGTVATVEFLEQRLTPVRGSGLGVLFATAFCLATFGGGLFGLRRARVTELAAAYVYAGSAVGVTFAGDLITLFVFWEIMAVAATLVIWASDQPDAYGAGMRFLLVHVFGGVLLMFGLAAHIAATGSAEFGPLEVEGWAAASILAAFLINAGAPPLSSWIPDAYPEASPSGMIFLSVLTTKTAVYALLVSFAGTALLIPVGLYMVAYGAIYALREDDMRRILAYMIVGSVGFMVAGAGIGGEHAVEGVAAYAFASILYKTLLVMAAGAVLVATGRRACSELGGLAASMPLAAAAGVVGALTLGSFPFTAGFVSKALLIDAAAEAHLAAPWIGLTAGSAALFVVSGVAFLWFVFFRPGPGLLRPDRVPVEHRVGLGVFAAACVGFGVAPSLLYGLVPGTIDYQPYTPDHLVLQVQLLLASGLVFVLLPRLFRRRSGPLLDWDWLYRRPGPVVAGAVTDGVARGRDRLETRVRSRLRAILDRLFETHGPHGILARTWPTGSMVLWVGVLLAAFLLFYYV